MAKQHQNNAAQMRSELEEPLAAFAGGMKERRKIVQNSIEKLHKVKQQQTQLVNKVSHSCTSSMRELTAAKEKNGLFLTFSRQEISVSKKASR